MTKEGNENDLSNHNNDKDNDKVTGSTNTSKYVEFVIDNSTVNKVKQLHPDENIENISVMN